MHSRAQFNALRKGGKALVERDARLLGIVAVGGGFAQLLFIRWADRNLARQVGLWIEGIGFLLYMGVVAVLLFRILRHQRAVAIRCPACNAALVGVSLSVAAATSRCDQCGGQVIGD
jgi:hypothetical protein